VDVYVCGRVFVMEPGGLRIEKVEKVEKIEKVDQPHTVHTYGRPVPFCVPCSVTSC